jgi:hypothetical protein
LAEKYSLTDAEVAAILQYTADDYKYVNPVVANRAGWLIAQKGKAALAPRPRCWGVWPKTF